MFELNITGEAGKWSWEVVFVIDETKFVVLNSSQSTYSPSTHAAYRDAQEAGSAALGQAVTATMDAARNGFKPALLA